MTDFYVKSVVNTTETDRTAGYIDTVGCDNGNEDHYGFVVIQDYVDKVGTFYYNYTSVDTEMCCPKDKCGCQYFILLTLKKKKIMDTGVLDFFNKKLILDYYFCLKSSPVFLFQIFIIAPLPLPRDIKLYH